MNHEIVDQDEIHLGAGRGIEGDRFYDYKEDYKGQITFFDGATWDAVRNEFGLEDLSAAHFRRNVIIRGVDLNELIGKTFSLGELRFSGSEESTPCYWMNEACAPGVEDFLKGRGGLRCRILTDGPLQKGTYQMQVSA